MCNVGKYIDRSPTLNAAGHDTYQKEESVARCLVDPNTNYKYDELQIQKKFQDYSLPPLRGDPYAGFLTKMRSILQAPSKSIFEKLLEEFQETRYDSYWNKRLGRSRDFTPGLPPSINPEIYRFGVKTDGGNNIGDVVNPKKSEWEIITESEIGHDLYLKSHKDYYPGEQIDRNYNHPQVNKNLVFGQIVPHDKHGALVRGVMKWPQKFDTITGEIKKKAMEKSNQDVGKQYAPNKNIEEVPKGYKFGVLSFDEYSVADSLRECPLSAEKTELMEVLEIINSLRLKLSKQRVPFPFRDLTATFQHRDKKLTGVLSFETIYEIFLLFRIMISKKTLEIICKRMNLMNEDNLINYNKLTDVINSNCSLPEFKKIDDVPKELLLYKSEYQDNYDRTNKEKGVKGTRYNDDKLTGENNVYELITPSIYTQYGLSHHDFFKTCTKPVMNRIFKKAGIDIPDDTFEKIWEMAGKKSEDGKVNLNTFKEVIIEIIPHLQVTF